ncbi:MAG: glycosyltransferase family 4 protein [Bacteroidales bacterium]|nr:glycosyltransferase family 4 protein [Bacteroidales bacterium]
MRVLFVSSGRNGSVGNVVFNQGQSLTKNGLEIEYFLINPGFLSYISSIGKIKKKFQTGQFDLIHAHYSLSAFSAALAGPYPLVVSLMGSDIYMTLVFRLISKIFILSDRWKAIIVKSLSLKSKLKLTHAYIIPNGVDLCRFQSIPIMTAKEIIRFPKDKKIVLFLAPPNRAEKNHQLAIQAIQILNKHDIELKTIYNVPNEFIPHYLSASDVILLTSKWEGSPNVIKEAMACNCPIVATDVGDIKWVIGQTEGCYITSFDPKDVVGKIQMALNFNKRTQGRNRILELGLDSETIAKKIIDVYHEVISKQKKKGKY